MTLPRLAQPTDMPELRRDLAARGMHFAQHLGPALERVAVEQRHVRIARRRRMLGRGTFGDDQTDATFGTPSVIGRDVLTRDTAWRERARHRRHDDAIRELEIARIEELE